MKNTIRFLKNPTNLSCVSLLLFLFLLFKIKSLETPGAAEETQDKNREKKDAAEKEKSLLQDMSDPFHAFPRVIPHSCVNVTQSSVASAWTMVCVNDPQFNDIAREIAHNGAWEVWLSQHLVQGMINYPKAVLLDIGSNIGPHSLTVAAMQREVVVVDAVFYNLALISLSHKITNKGKVKILYNSISDKQGEQLYPYLEAQHQHMAGATYLVTKEDLDSGKYKWEEVIGPPAVSVTTKDIFDQIDSDVVIIKIDVEGHECKALQPEILDQSTGKYVPYIFMEWANLRLNRHHTCDHYQHFIDSFTSNGYYPAEPGTLVPVELAKHTEWFDVVWIHKDSVKIVV